MKQILLTCMCLYIHSSTSFGMNSDGFRKLVYLCTQECMKKLMYAQSVQPITQAIHTKDLRKKIRIPEDTNKNSFSL